MSAAELMDNLRYLMLGAWPEGPIGGAALTLMLTGASALLASLIGIALGTALFVLRGWTLALLQLTLGLLRSIPVLMLIFWVYFLGPIAFGLDVPGLLAVVAALALIGGAYLAHSVHAGIAALPPGQWEAAAASGLSRRQTWRFVVIPQVLPQIAPSFLNQLIALTKDSSLAYVIGVADLSFVATQLSNRLLIYPFQIYLFVAALYYVLCLMLEALAAFLTRRHRNQPA